MKIIFDDYEKTQIAKYADEYEVDPEVIEEIYTEAISSNFDDDLEDIVVDNEDAIEDAVKEKIDYLREKEEVCGLDKEDAYELERLLNRRGDE